MRAGGRGNEVERVGAAAMGEGRNTIKLEITSPRSGAARGAALETAPRTMKLVVLLALPPLSRGWGDGHPLITRAALPLLPASFISGLRRSNTTFLGLTRPVAEFVAGTAASKDIFDWSESADVVAGPCTVSPCPALELQAKLTFRRYCYAEDSAGAYTPPWPFAVPACGANVTSGCLPGPVRDSWMYHYFNETPSVNEGIEARGASWYLGRAALALRGGNLSTAALHLGCFSHALQDRSSPYHAWGGYTAAKKRVEVEYRTTETCLASNLSAADKRRCEILFWAPGNEPAVNWSAGGYAPIVLGASAAEAGAAVGARLEELAARARGVMLRPTDGFVASHLRDGDWWLRTSSPATLRAMGEMGRESTRLVADAWLTAWALAHDASAQLAPLLPPRRPVPLVGAALTEWAAAVRQAAQRDREVDEAADSAGGAAAHRAVRRGGRTRGHELGWGEPPLLVAVATDASPSEAFAARSLVRILSQSGVPSKAVSAADAAGQPHVAVGAGAAVASNATLARELDALGTEDFVCRSNASPSMPSGAAQPTLVLSGSSASPRGTLNAVFRLLRHLGYRHYAPDAPPALPTNLSAAAVLAPRSSARCGAAAPRQRPSIAVRTLNAFSAGVASLPNDVNASEFAVANQLNGAGDSRAASSAIPSARKPPHTTSASPLPSATLARPPLRARPTSRAAVVRDFALNETYGGSVYYAGGFVHTSYDLAPPCASWISAGTCAANDTSGLNYSHPEWRASPSLSPSPRLPHALAHTPSHTRPRALALAPTHPLMHPPAPWQVRRRAALLDERFARGAPHPPRARAAAAQPGRPLRECLAERQQPLLHAGG